MPTISKWKVFLHYIELYSTSSSIHYFVYGMNSIQLLSIHWATYNTQNCKLSYRNTSFPYNSHHPNLSYTILYHPQHHPHGYHEFILLIIWQVEQNNFLIQCSLLSSCSPRKIDFILIVFHINNTATSYHNQFKE